MHRAGGRRQGGQHLGIMPLMANGETTKWLLQSRAAGVKGVHPKMGTVDVVIIGAGPYGLSAAAHLREYSAPQCHSGNSRCLSACCYARRTSRATYPIRAGG